MADQRLIDANALLNSFDVAWMVEYDETGCGVRKKAIPTKTIDEAPTIEAVEVMHGRWNEPTGRFVDGFWACSVCNFCTEASAAPQLYKYCPNCGAKMDGGVAE